MLHWEYYRGNKYKIIVHTRDGQLQSEVFIKRDDVGRDVYSETDVVPKLRFENLDTALTITKKLIEQREKEKE